MCIFSSPKVPAAAPVLIPSTANREAEQQAGLEDRLRRMRAGAAANVLTSPTGIPARPAVAKLGQV